MWLLKDGREILFSSCRSWYREVPSFVPSDRCGQKERTKEEIAVVRLDRKNKPVLRGMFVSESCVSAFASGLGGVGEC